MKLEKNYLLIGTVSILGFLGGVGFVIFDDIHSLLSVHDTPQSITGKDEILLLTRNQFDVLEVRFRADDKHSLFLVITPQVTYNKEVYGQI